MSLCPAPTAPPTDDHALIGNLTDCDYFGLFGTDNSSIANLVPGGSSPAEVGTLTFGADYMGTHSNSGVVIRTLTLPSSIEPGEDWFMVVLATRETSGAYIAAPATTNAEGVSVDEHGLFGNSVGPKFRNSQSSFTGEAKGLWPSSTSNYYFIAGWGQDRGPSYVQTGYAGTMGGALGGGNLSNRPKRASASLLQLNPDIEGNIEVNFTAVAVFKRLPAAGETQAIYTAMRDYFNARGNIVVE